MTTTERRYFVAPDRHGLDGLYLAYRGAVIEYHPLAEACRLASTDPDTRGCVYERADSGTVRMVAQMAVVS